MIAALLILFAQPAAPYALPEGTSITAPTAVQQVRIERALTALQGREPGPRERAVREIALIGAPSLPAVVVRLNAGDRAERALLLTAIARLPEARRLLEQARGDPAAIVRAAVDAPHQAPRSLAQLAARFVDLLALTRNAKREEITAQLQGLKPGLARTKEQYDAMRRYLGDDEVDRAIREEYRVVSWQFARAGRDALKRGALKPDLAEPVFVAYLGLMYDEEMAAVVAVEGLVESGSAATNALKQLLDREGHDPRLIGHLLTAVGSGSALMAKDGKKRPNVRFAQIEMASLALPRDEAIAFLTERLGDTEARNRKAAMAELLELRAAPPAKPLFQRSKDFGDEEWKRALRLRLLAGDNRFFEEVVNRGPRPRRAFAAVLRELKSDVRAAFLPRLLTHSDAALRWLAVDLSDDAAPLLELARTTEDARLREHAVRRAIELGDVSGIALIESPGARTIRALRKAGEVDRLVAYALRDDTGAAALRELRNLARIDAKHEAALLKLYRDAEEPHKWELLDALVPLGTEQVRLEMIAVGEHAIAALGAYADDERKLPFSIPLMSIVENANGPLLKQIARLAASMPNVEPGLFLKLLARWDRIEIDPTDHEAGSAQHKIDAVRHLVRVSDPRSVEALFQRVVSLELREESMVVVVLQAAARQLSAERLADLVPVMDVEVRKFAPNSDGLPPDPDPPRDYFVWYAIRALSYRQVDAALIPLCRIALEPTLQRERFDVQAERPLPPDFTLQAREALRHYDSQKVIAALRTVIAELDRDGRLADLTPAHLFRLLSGWRSNAWRGRRLHGFAITLCDLIDRYPFEGETGIARMLALGAQRRYEEAAQAGVAAADRVAAREFSALDGGWSPARIRGRAAIYSAVANNNIPELFPKLDDNYLLWIAGIYMRFLTNDYENARVAANLAARASAWLDRDVRNLTAELTMLAGDAEAACRMLQPQVTAPVEPRQDEAWYRYYFARALSKSGRTTRARGELAESLRMNRRLIASCRVDPLLKDFTDVFRQTEEDFFDQVFSE